VTYIALVGGAFLVWLLLVLLFTPALNYRVRTPLGVDDPDFLRVLQSTCQASLATGNRIDVCADGERFYPAMLAAIASARQSINLECYILQSGRVADMFIAALTERARAGVMVTIVIDAIGSAMLSRADGRRLADAGCRLERYQPLTWYRLARLNNRTHRELLVIDGRVAFLGGAGIADWWQREYSSSQPAWRDTMVRVEGPVVAGLQGVFVENWLECCGEILTGDEFFPRLENAGGTVAFVIRSSPADRATISRVAFQMLFEGARRHIRVATPYFLPDRSLRRALMKIAQSGVRIDILVPGRKTDQRWVRIASRRNYGRLLEAGIRIFEYGPAMTHAKVLIVDDDWSVVGTTNVDNRSFEHNDEINLAMLDRAIAGRLLDDFERDLQSATQVTLAGWRSRPWWEKLIGPVVWILERQQ
jgi:cardiolipin synthase